MTEDDRTMMLCAGGAWDGKTIGVPNGVMCVVYPCMNFHALHNRRLKKYRGVSGSHTHGYNITTNPDATYGLTYAWTEYRTTFDDPYDENAEFTTVHIKVRKDGKV